MKWYVYFINMWTMNRDCICFENDEKQTKHFSKEVSGIVCEENEIPDWNLIEKNFANCDIYADFEDWYGNKNAKVLCIMIK